MKKINELTLDERTQLLYDLVIKKTTKIKDFMMKLKLPDPNEMFDSSFDPAIFSSKAETIEVPQKCIYSEVLKEKIWIGESGSGEFFEMLELTATKDDGKQGFHINIEFLSIINEEGGIQNLFYSYKNIYNFEGLKDLGEHEDNIYLQLILETRYFNNFLSFLDPANFSKSMKCVFK